MQCLRAQRVSMMSSRHTGLCVGRMERCCGVISALFGLAERGCCCTNHPDLAQLRIEANAGLLSAKEPNVPRRIIRVSDRKIIRFPKAALSSKEA